MLQIPKMTMSEKLKQIYPRSGPIKSYKKHGELRIGRGIYYAKNTTQRLTTLLKEDKNDGTKNNKTT